MLSPMSKREGVQRGVQPKGIGQLVGLDWIGSLGLVNDNEGLQERISHHKEVDGRVG